MIGTYHFRGRQERFLLAQSEKTSFTGRWCVIEHIRNYAFRNCNLKTDKAYMLTKFSHHRAADMVPSRLALVLVLFSLLPMTPSDARLVMGEGNQSCRVWTKERQSNSIRSRLQETWLLGYITGHSWGDKSKPDFLFGADIDGMFAWVDEYCRLNPQNDLVNAADELVGVLLKKAETPL